MNVKHSYLITKRKSMKNIQILLEDNTWKSKLYSIS